MGMLSRKVVSPSEEIGEGDGDEISKYVACEYDHRHQAILRKLFFQGQGRKTPRTHSVL